MTRDRLVEEVLGDVDVFMRLRSLDSPLYLDRVDSSEYVGNQQSSVLSGSNLDTGTLSLVRSWESVARLWSSKPCGRAKR